MKTQQQQRFDLGLVPDADDYAAVRRYLREDPAGPRTTLTPIQVAMLWSGWL